MPPSIGSTTPFGSTLPSAPRRHVNVEDVAALVGGAARVRRAAQSLAALGRMTDCNTRVEQCAANLDRELHALQSWYVSLGSALVKRRQVPPPHIRDTEGRSRLLACVRDAPRGRDKATVAPLSSCSGRASISTTSGVSRHTSGSAQTPHGRLHPHRNRLGHTRAAREPRAHRRAIARRPREVREMAMTSATLSRPTSTTSAMTQRGLRAACIAPYGTSAQIMRPTNAE